VLFTKLGIRRAQNESPVLLSVQPSLSRRTYERITRVFFERLNVAAFSIIERPLAQLYAANNLSGVVIDIGESATDITPVVDSLIYHNACRTLDVGIKDCEAHFCNILRNNQSLIKMISPPENPLSPEDLSEALLSIAQQTWRDGLIKAPLEGEPVVQEEELLNDIAAVLVAGKEKAVIETGLKKRASAKATAAERERAREIEAMDLIQIQWRDLTLTMGKERHRFCEPLFDPALQARIRGSDPIVTQSLQEAVHQSVRGVDVDLRVKVWDGVFIAGDISSAVKGAR
jgi:actin-related protein 9